MSMVSKNLKYSFMIEIKLRHSNLIPKIIIQSICNIQVQFFQTLYAAIQATESGLYHTFNLKLHFGIFGNFSTPCMFLPLHHIKNSPCKIDICQKKNIKTAAENSCLPS